MEVNSEKKKMNPLLVGDSPSGLVEVVKEWVYLWEVC